MASSYSNSLKIQLMGNGEDSGTWGTPSKEQDAQIVKNKKDDYDKAVADFKKREAEKSKMMEGYNSMSGSDVSSADLANAMTSNKNDIESRRKAVADAIETKAANDEKRKAYEQMISDAKKDAEQAAKLHESRKDRADAANKDSANELEESNANTKSKFAKMHVSSLQAIGGGYVRPAAFETIARQQLHHLSNIDRQTKGGGNKGGGTSKGAF